VQQPKASMTPRVESAPPSKGKQKFYRAGTKREEERKTLVSMRLPRSLVAIIQAITLEGIATKRYKWRTYTETYEAMITKGLKTMKDDAFMEEQLPVINLTEHFAAITHTRMQAQASLSMAQREITELLKIDALDEALQYYHTTKAAGETMPPTIWRDWFLSKLKTSFPDLESKIAPGIQLVHGNRNRHAAK
jgi:hypothetical protein